MNKKILLFLLFGFSALFLVSCIPGDGKHTAANTAGFFWGIWHGWLAPVSLIIGLFKDGIRVYEINNTGWWYDFGFYLAVVGGFGGLSLFRKEKSRGYREYRRSRKEY